MESQVQWRDMPEQVRWRRGFFGGLMVGIQVGILIMLLAMWLRS